MATKPLASSYRSCTEQELPSERAASLPAPLIRWVDALRERKLDDLAHLFIRVLQVWGYAGGQLLWMLAPFLGDAAVTPLAQALEDPEALEILHARIAEGVPG